MATQGADPVSAIAGAVKSGFDAINTGLGVFGETAEESIAFQDFLTAGIPSFKWFVKESPKDYGILIVIGILVVFIFLILLFTKNKN